MAEADHPTPGPLTRSQRRPKRDKDGKPIIIESGEKNFIPATKIYPKAPRPVLVPITGETMWVRPWFYTLGDIVSMYTRDDPHPFFAQITGMLKDQYDGKYAIICWLIPTTDSIPGRFDPDTYLFCLQEDTPRDMAAMEFVCHAPNEYYKSKVQPFREKSKFGFAQTSKGYRIVKLPAEEFNTDSE